MPINEKKPGIKIGQGRKNNTKRNLYMSQAQSGIGRETIIYAQK